MQRTHSGEHRLLNAVSATPVWDGLLLGRAAAPQARAGFRANATVRTGAPITYRGDAHLLTIAPTGAGKGVGSVIPNALLYPGPLIVFDPKGEAYAVTRRQREALGQQVVLLDPFGVTGGQGGGTQSARPGGADRSRPPGRCRRQPGHLAHRRATLHP